jgi:hypothetical protein
MLTTISSLNVLASWLSYYTVFRKRYSLPFVTYSLNSFLTISHLYYKFFINSYQKLRQL